MYFLQNPSIFAHLNLHIPNNCSTFVPEMKRWGLIVVMLLMAGFRGFGFGYAWDAYTSARVQDRSYFISRICRVKSGWMTRSQCRKRRNPLYRL